MNSGPILPIICFSFSIVLPILSNLFKDRVYSKTILAEQLNLTLLKILYIIKNLRNVLKLGGSSKYSFRHSNFVIRHITPADWTFLIFVTSSDCESTLICYRKQSADAGSTFTNYRNNLQMHRCRTHMSGELVTVEGYSLCIIIPVYVINVFYIYMCHVQILKH